MRGHGVEHIHKRKHHFDKKLKPYPHKNGWVAFLDQFLLLVAIVGPLVNLPQLFKILYEGTSAGVSILSWSLYTILAIPWLVYGIVHKEKPIIIAYTLWVILDAAVLVAAIAYA